jgi:putative membrane protein
MYQQQKRDDDDDETARGRNLSLRWALVPLLIAAGLVAVYVGFWLYGGTTYAASSAGATYPWYPFGWWFIFIPAFFLIFFAVRWYFWGGWWWGRGGWYYGGYDPALETLRRRYAKGEITKEQYDQMRRELLEA